MTHTPAQAILKLPKPNQNNNKKKKREKTTNAGEDVLKQELLYTVGGNES
jgi:hypothetical protein